MDYLDLKETQLKFKVTNPDGSDITSLKVGPVNLFLKAFFPDTEVNLQNKVVISSNYNLYTAIFHVLLYNGQDNHIFSIINSTIYER